MRNKLFLKTIALIVLLGAFSPHSFAQIRTLCIEGTVIYVQDFGNVLNGSVAIGDSLSGTIKYDLSLPNTGVASYVGDYRDSIPDVGFDLTIGSRFFRTDTNNVNFLTETVNDFNGRDNNLFRSYNNVFDPSIPVRYDETHIAWQLDDTNQTAISTTAIFDHIDLADWQQIFALTIEGRRVMNPMDSDIFIRVLVTSADTCVPLYYSIYRPAPTAVGNLTQAGDIKLYPNPFSTATTIQFDRSYTNASLVMYDIYGERVKSVTDINGDRMKLNRDNLSSGLYYIQIAESGRVIATKKVTITD